MVKVNTDPRKRGKYGNAKIGVFTPLHPEKYIGSEKPIYKSALELKFMRYCDRSAKIIKWAYENFSIKYLDKSSYPERIRNYHIDFVIYADVGKAIKKIWVEVKPSVETRKPINESDVKSMNIWLKNQSKWKQAAVTARQNGAEFRIITEQQLN